MNIFTQKEQREIIKSSPSKTGKVASVIGTGAFILTIILLAEILFYGGYLIQVQARTFLIERKTEQLITEKESSLQSLQEIIIDTPERDTAIELLDKGYPWSKTISEIESTTGINFDRITGSGDTLFLAGSTINRYQYSLTSLAKIAKRIEELPYVNEIAIESSDKEIISGQIYRSTFQISVSLNWESLRKKMSTDKNLNTINTNPKLSPPTEVTSIGEISSEKSSIVIHWEGSPDALMYFIFGGENESDFHFIGVATDTEFRYETKNPRQVYTFHIFAIDQGGRYSPHPTIITARAGDQKAPEPVSNLAQGRIIAEGENLNNLVTITLDWNPPADKDIKRYLIFSGFDQDNLVLIDQTTNPHYATERPLVEINNIWGVVSEDTSGNLSQPIFATTD